MTMLLALITVPMLVLGGATFMFAGHGGTGCTSQNAAPANQPAASAAGKGIPANYLFWYQKVGKQYNVPWTILAGIGTEESNNGQSTLPGVSSGQNGFGAAGPMQIGIGGASSDTWAQVATVEDGKQPPSVYDPADAIAGAAKYLIAHGVQTNPSAAVFAYNHADWYVQAVLSYASNYASGGFSVTTAQQNGGSSTCTGNTVLDSMTVPNASVASAVSYAQQQIGKPYVWGATGPDAFDCSGLVMMAYRAAGVNIARTSQEQWATEQQVPANQVKPGDLVFFAGSDGTPTSPGHVGIVIGKNEMIEAYATGFPVRVSSFGLPSSPGGENTVVGFTQPWSGSQVGSVAPGSVPNPASGLLKTTPGTGNVPVPGTVPGTKPGTGQAQKPATNHA
jgi:cell wall-associated NlpC family hydrolase